MVAWEGERGRGGEGDRRRDRGLGEGAIHGHGEVGKMMVRQLERLEAPGTSERWMAWLTSAMHRIPEGESSEKQQRWARASAGTRRPSDTAESPSKGGGLLATQHGERSMERRAWSMEQCEALLGCCL